MRQVTIVINGEPVTAKIDERTLLLDFIRDSAQLTGPKGGCYEARCGCCTVLADGKSTKACNALAVQFDGSSVTTVEGLGAALEGDAWDEEAESADGGGGGGLVSAPRLSALQSAFLAHGAVQCGFCTAGMLVVLTDLLEREPDPSEEQVRQAISGNLCRCTGYQKIVDAALDASARRREEAEEKVGARGSA